MRERSVVIVSCLFNSSISINEDVASWVPIASSLFWKKEECWQDFLARIFFPLIEVENPFGVGEGINKI